MAQSELTPQAAAEQVLAGLKWFQGKEYKGILEGINKNEQDIKKLFTQVQKKEKISTLLNNAQQKSPETLNDVTKEVNDYLILISYNIKKYEKALQINNSNIKNNTYSLRAVNESIAAVNNKIDEGKLDEKSLAALREKQKNLITRLEHLQQTKESLEQTKTNLNEELALLKEEEKLFLDLLKYVETDLNSEQQKKDLVNIDKKGEDYLRLLENNIDTNENTESKENDLKSRKRDITNKKEEILSLITQHKGNNEFFKIIFQADSTGMNIFHRATNDTNSTFVENKYRNADMSKNRESGTYYKDTFLLKILEELHRLNPTLVKEAINKPLPDSLKTPLMLATDKLNEYLIELFIYFGADRELIDSGGKKAIDFTYNNKRLTELFDVKPQAEEAEETASKIKKTSPPTEDSPPIRKTDTKEFTPVRQRTKTLVRLNPTVLWTEIDSETGGYKTTERSLENDTPNE